MVWYGIVYDTIVNVTILYYTILYCTVLYTQSPLQDSRLLGPRPWKILAATYEQMGS